MPKDFGAAQAAGTHRARRPNPWEYEMDLPAPAEFERDVRAARAAMDALFEPTPLQENVFLSERYGARIFLKREDLTPVRSYKIRGAFNFLRKRIGAGETDRFVCASAGNHAQGFAYACRHFGVTGTVFMSFALAGLVTDGITIVDPGCVAKTFPAYWDVLARLGVELRPAG